MSERVSKRRAAKVLGIGAHTTLLRYLRRYPELVDADGKVDPEVVRAHRGENLQVEKSASHAGRLMDERSAEPEQEREPAKPTSISAGGSAYSKARAARESILARRAQLDLDERIGRLVPRDEVEAAIAEAVHVLQQELDAAARDLAERLPALADRRERRLAIIERHRGALDRAAAALARFVREESDVAA